MKWRRCVPCLKTEEDINEYTRVRATIVEDEQTKFKKCYNEDRIRRLRNPDTLREYRFASLFGAGSGLPATLGMIHAAITNSLKHEDNVWLTYLSFDGVSAGALVRTF